MALSRVPGDDELFVGGIFTLRRPTALQELGITHILSVLRYDFKNFQDWGKYEHLSVEVDDMEDENLLGEFERTGAWIEDALEKGKEGKDGEEKKQGKVFVHCAMGKSRSVTIVVAFLLRKYPHHTPSTALALIRESRPIAEPNDGFMAQLELYKEMGCPRDIENHPRYQKWLYGREVDLAVQAGMAPDRVRFEDEEVQELNEGRGEEREVELRCRKCRRTLATTPYLITHSPIPFPSTSSPSTSSAISSLLPSQPPPPTHTLCTHHFLSPLSWMRPALEQGLLSGRLECPNSKCAAQIGRYAWQGLKCSCGAWVCPGFSLLKARCDEVVLRKGGGEEGKGKDGFRVSGEVGAGRGGVEGGGIRLPPGMKGKGNL